MGDAHDHEQDERAIRAEALESLLIEKGLLTAEEMGIMSRGRDYLWRLRWGLHMLTGRNVFEGETSIEIVRKHLEEEPVPPSTHFPGLPADLEQVVLECLAKDPEDRPGSAHELIDRLEACGCAGQWNQRQAAQWWAASGPDDAAEPVVTTAPTVQTPVDDPGATRPISPP